MRKFKKVFGIVTVLMLVLTMLPVSVFATEAGPKVGSYTVGVSKSTITVGGSANLTITAKKAAGQFTVKSSNPAVVKVGTSNVWVDGSHSDAAGKVTIKAVAAGTATITVTPVNVSDRNYNLLTNTKTITITVKTKTTTPTEDKDDDKTTTTKKSSDATLKSLTSSVVDLDFSKNITNYTVHVDKTVTSLGLKATVNNSKAKVKITGDENFVIGNNIVKVVVTAEDGTTKTYTITVVKSKYGSGPLLDLKVKGYELSPEFDPSRLTYSVDAVGITSVELEYTLVDKASTVVIEGTDNLKVGENQVKLTVTEKDGTVTTYTVNVNVAPSADVVEQENNTIWLIIILILVLLIVVETIYIVVKKKKEGK